MQAMPSLEQFLFEASITPDTRTLRSRWDRFVSKFGSNGYRIVPANLALLKTLYDLIEFDRKPVIRFPVYRAQRSRLDTVVDIAAKTPPGWREYYHEQRFYRHDALLVKEIASRAPFTRNETLAEFNSPQTRQMIALATEAGLRNTLSMSWWLDPDTLVGTTIYFSESDPCLDELSRRILQAAASLFCARYLELSGNQPAIAEQDAVVLTPRERDVLQWIALGKTKLETAELLGISMSSVKRYCENASEKLGANTMVNAVARALSTGLISP